MKCITYVAAKTEAVVLNALQDNTQKVVFTDNVEVAYKRIKALCGNVFYKSLFVLPDYQLQDRCRYEIAAVIYCIDGFMKEDARNLLENITDLASSKVISCSPALIKILHEAVYREIMEALHVPFDTYTAFFRYFLFVSDLPQKRKDKLLTLVRTPNVDINELWNIFEEEVYKPGKYFY